MLLRSVGIVGGEAYSIELLEYDIFMITDH